MGDSSASPLDKAAPAAALISTGKTAPVSNMSCTRTLPGVSDGAAPAAKQSSAGGAALGSCSVLSSKAIATAGARSVAIAWLVAVFLARLRAEAVLRLLAAASVVRLALGGAGLIEAFMSDTVATSRWRWPASWDLTFARVGPVRHPATGPRSAPAVLPPRSRECPSLDSRRANSIGRPGVRRERSAEWEWQLVLENSRRHGVFQLQRRPAKPKCWPESGSPVGAPGMRGGDANLERVAFHCKHRSAGSGNLPYCPRLCCIRRETPATQLGS